MRWFWIDRFTEFVSGNRAVAIKNFSLAEECFHDYFSGYPIMPGSIMLEGLAQTAGVLLGEHNHYRERVVLGKVSRVKYYGNPLPGDQLRYTVTLSHIRPQGALVEGECHVGGLRHAEASFFLAVLPTQHEAEHLFDPKAFVRLLRLLRVYDVGVASDGSRLRLPPHLLATEAAELTSRGKI